MPNLLTNTQRAYGKQVGTGFIVGMVFWAGWVIDNSITGRGLWVWVFPFLAARSITGLITGGSIFAVVIILTTIWIFRPSESRVEYIQQ